MLKTSILLAVILMIGSSFAVQAQRAGSDRAGALAASLNKEKYKKKENKYVSIEIYINIKNEVAARSDQSEYTGTYFSDGYKMDLRVSRTGDVTATGYDSPMGNDKVVNFELRDARIDGGLLTGTKVYENGEARKFEAVFVNRSVETGKNKDKIESSETSFGLGFVESGPVVAGNAEKTSEWTNRVFLERKN